MPPTQLAATRRRIPTDKGKLVGSPERLNVFTLEGDVLRLDLEIEVKATAASASPLAYGCAQHGVCAGRLRRPPRARLATAAAHVVWQAHLGSTLHPSDTIVLEKGNRIDDERLQAVRRAAAKQSR